MIRSLKSTTRIIQPFRYLSTRFFSRLSNLTPEQTKLIHSYIINKGNDISPIKMQLRAHTMEFEKAAMLSTIEQGELFKFLVKISGAKKGIEIGTFTGYSALCFAQGLGPSGKLLALDVSKEFTDVAKSYWAMAGVSDRIELILGPALQTLEKLRGNKSQLKSFDFGFVDADKPNQKQYIEQLLDLVKPGGFIIVDNTLFGGSAVSQEIRNNPAGKYVDEANQFIKNCERVQRSMIMLADGISFLYVK